MLNSSCNYTTPESCNYTTPVSCNYTTPECPNDTISSLIVGINASVTVIIASFCIVGNSAFIILFAFNKNIRNLNNHAVVCLAFGDVLRGTIVMIPKMVTEFGHKCDITPHWFGAITAFASAFTFVFNPMILALIAFIRYIIIVPWTKRAQWLTFAKLHVIICLIFFGAVLFSCLPFMSNDIGTYEFSIFHGVYFTSWEHKNEIFRIIFYICVIGIAFPVLILSYVKIGLALRDHNRKMKTVMPKSMLKEPIVGASVELVKNYESIKSTTTTKLEQSSETSKSRLLCICCFPCLKKNKCQTSSSTKAMGSSKQRVNTNLTKQEYQTTKMMFLICIAYIICWFPAAVVNSIALVNVCAVSGAWKMAIVTIIEVKTCLNPIFYGLGNKQYRKIVIDFFKKQCKCRRR